MGRRGSGGQRPQAPQAVQQLTPQAPAPQVAQQPKPQAPRVARRSKRVGKGAPQSHDGRWATPNPYTVLGSVSTLTQEEADLRAAVSSSIALAAEEEQAGAQAALAAVDATYVQGGARTTSTPAASAREAASAPEPAAQQKAQDVAQRALTPAPAARQGVQGLVQGVELPTRQQTELGDDMTEIRRRGTAIAALSLAADRICNGSIDSDDRRLRRLDRELDKGNRYQRRQQAQPRPGRPTHMTNGRE